MVLNHRNCQFMCIHKNLCDSELINFNDNILRNCREVEILGITLARNVNFRSHIKKLKQQRLSTLLRVSSYADANKKVLLYRSVVKSKSTNCPAWMFCLRQSNKMINKVHEKALRPV